MMALLTALSVLVYITACTVVGSVHAWTFANCKEGQIICHSVQGEDTCIEPKIEICCGGIRRSANADLDCCRSDLNSLKSVDTPDGGPASTEVLYNITSQLCCSGKVYDNTNQDLGCCNGTIYNRTENFCCGDTHLYSIMNTKDNYFCCGTEQYDPQNHLCCEDIENQNSLFTLTPLKDGAALACCGHKSYDRQETDCVFPKDEKCGDENISYNTAESLCCNGKVHPRETGYHLCCGDDPFDQRSQICCDETSSPYVKPRYTKIGNEIVEQQCCKNAQLGVIHGHTQLCCSGNPYNRTSDSEYCCGHNVYDRSSYECCNGTVYKYTEAYCCGGHVLPHYEKCCEGKWPMASDEVCCSRTGPQRKRGSHTACCEEHVSPFRVALYNPGIDKCVDGLVHRKSDKKCGRRLYDPEMEICCNGFKRHRFHSRYDFESGSDEMKCCGIHPYNPKDHMCCHGRIRQGSPLEFKCHGKNVEKIKQRCDDSEQLCGRTQCFDPNTSFCCTINEESFVLKRHDNASHNVCPCSLQNNTVYNPDTERCINGKVVSLQDLRKSQKLEKED